MINTLNKTITEDTMFSMQDADGYTYMIGDENDESVQEFSLFELVSRAYEFTQKRGLPYMDCTLRDLQNTWKMLANKTPKELAEWVEATMDVTLKALD